jgi:hypothetical protein
MDRAGLSWPSAGSVDCLLCFIRSIALFSHRHVLMIFYLHLLTRFFSKKRCEHMPSSFRVNNLLHQNLLNYSIFLDLKTTKKSKLNFPVSMTGTSLNSFGRCNQSSLLLQIVSWSSCSLIAKDCLALSQDCLSCDNNLSPLSFFPYKTHPFVQGFLHELPRFLVFYPMNTLTLLVLRMGGIFPWKNLQEMAIATSRWQTLTWNCISSRCC